MAGAKGDEAAGKGQDETKERVPKEETIRTRHQVAVDGQEVAYTATVGTILLKEEDATPKASVLYVAYWRRPTLRRAVPSTTLRSIPACSRTSQWATMRRGT